MRNSRSEELGGGGEYDGARQSGRNEGEGDESVRQTDDRGEETDEQWGDFRERLK